MTTTPLSSRRPPALTTSGREQLADRLERLRATTLPELRDQLLDPEKDGRIDIEYERVLFEIATLEELLAVAGDLTAADAEPGVVALGRRVTVELPDGSRERVRVVHPAEAPLDGERVSAEAPLARAIEGHRAGDVVSVAAPGGEYTCRIVKVENGIRRTGRAPGGAVPRQEAG